MTRSTFTISVRHIVLYTVIQSSLGCGLATSVKTWSYKSPPKPGAKAALPDGSVWCDSLEKAVFMATTGFFALGCYPSPLLDGTFTVTNIEHIHENDVGIWVVQICDIRGNKRWIPLPDHNWA